ncbi:zinc ribbon domain-containing protein [Acidithiobacillus caldus]|nr:zinc ribbon domain-containing protein [Acidithiobacillus caldus]
MKPPTPTLRIAPQIQGQHVVYEYGARIDSTSEVAIDTEIRRARALYNEIVEVLRALHDAMQAFVLERAPQTARDLVAQIARYDARFREAKAQNDRAAMQEIANRRNEARKALSPQMQEVRKAHKDELIERFYRQIGTSSRTATYACRVRAVQGGLGPYTANQVLEAALRAWKQSMKNGHPPRFIRYSEKTQDTLTIQFPEAGGVAAEDLFTGKRRDVIVAYPQNGFRRRSYTRFRFRLGPATAECYAQGTLQVDREPPHGARVTLVRLIRKRVGPRYRYTLQFLLNLADPIRLEVANRRKPLVALHFGWSFDEAGRQIAGISDNGNATDAHILSLPPSIEADLTRAATIRSQRDIELAAVAQRLKTEWKLPSLPEGDALRSQWEEFCGMPAHRISSHRLHALATCMRDRSVIPEWFDAWRKTDKLAWQSQMHKVRSARNRRTTFYRQVALDLARQYETIVLELPDLKKTTQKVNSTTGEKTELNRKARAGRVIASLHSLEAALHWAACKCGSAVLHLSGEPTVTLCSHCGSTTISPTPLNNQMLCCSDCGSTIDRKANGAANAWKLAQKQREKLVSEYWDTVGRKRCEMATLRAQKASGRAQARRASAAAKEKNRAARIAALDAKSEP